MAQLAIRFSGTTDKRIQEATERRGFWAPTCKGNQGQKKSPPEGLVASIEQVKGDLLVPRRSHHALFALVDGLAKILLTCTPEPDIHALEAAAPGPGQALRLLKAGPDSRLAIQELVKHGER